MLQEELDSHLGYSKNQKSDNNNARNGGLGQNESATFWQGVLTDLRARGVEDILISVTDNLNGFTQSIKNVFPKAETQIC